MITLHELTAKSLKLDLLFNTTVLGTATGYVVSKNSKHYLVSNYHVFSGRNSFTNEPVHSLAGVPNKVKIYHHLQDKLGHFIPVEENLIDPTGNNLFFTSTRNPRFDVAILELKFLTNVQVNAIDYKALGMVNIPIWPSQDVSIIGFPFGLSSNACFPIWKTGHIASELDLPFQGLPCFLVDAATRGGMSGSPVFALIRSPYQDLDGSTKITTGTPIRFLGTYSGRLTLLPNFLSSFAGDEAKKILELGSDIGMVWNWDLIDQLI